MKIIIFQWMIISVLVASGSSANAGSQIGLEVMSYAGESNANVSGSYAQGLNFRTIQDKGIFRFAMGFNTLYSQSLTYIEKKSYQSKLISSDIHAGLILNPFQTAKVSPYLGVFGLIGCKYLELSNPPTDVTATTISLSYGGSVALGIHLNTSASRYYDFSIEYTSNRASELANQKDFGLNGLSFKVAYGF